MIQHHADAAAYVFAGGQPSLMRALFSDRERPFYGQARPLELPPLPLGEAAHEIEALFYGSGLDPEGAVDALLTFSGGHPQRTVLLAHHLYNVLDSPEKCSDPAADALDRAVSETSDAHQAVWDGIGRVERIVLIALADGQAASGTRVSREHRIPRSTLQDAVERLVSDDQHVHRGDRGRPVLLDPLLGEWLRRR